MQSREKLSPFDELYEAAKAKNKIAFEEALKRSVNGIELVGQRRIHNYFFNVVSLLAYEGNKEAVTFIFNDAPQDVDRKQLKNFAAIGYAIRGDDDEVTKLVKERASTSVTIKGYAIAKNVKKVDELLWVGKKGIFEIVGDDLEQLGVLLKRINSAKDGYDLSVSADQLKRLKKNLNEALYDYVRNENKDAVDLLLANGASKKALIYSYARAGLVGQIEKLCVNAQEPNSDMTELTILDIAIRGYAEAGKTNLVNELLARGANINYAIRGYAQGGHGKQVNELLPRKGADKNYAVLGYAEAGNKTLVNKLLAEGASREYAIIGYSRGKHQAALDELAVAIQYEKQQADQRTRRILVVLAAIFLTPLSLIVTLPIWFLAKSKDPIQEGATSAEKSVKDTKKILEFFKQNDSITKEKNAFEKINATDSKATKNVVWVEQTNLTRIESELWSSAKGEFNSKKETAAEKAKRAISAGMPKITAKSFD